MKILLANMDLYQGWIDRAALKFTGFDDGVYEQAAARDYGEYALAGSDAVIQVTGPLSYKYDFWTWLTDGSSYQGLMAQIQAAGANTDVHRIVVLFDTPGGEVTGVREAAATIANSPKPVVAMVDPCCASAGLWLATQAPRIVSIESGEIGSLGVQCVSVSYSKMLEEAGIDMKIVRAAISPDKNLGHPYEPRSERATEHMQDRVDRYGQMFVESVAAGRNVSSEDVLAKFGQGKMLDADEALEAGLVDEIGSLGSLLAESRSGSSRTGNSRRRRATLHRHRR